MHTQTITSSLRRAFIALAVALLALTVIAPLATSAEAFSSECWS